MEVMAASHHWGFFPLFWIGWLVLIAVLFFGRWFWWRRYPADRGGRGSGEAALAERYARGEIDEHEYRNRLAVLRER